MIRQAVKAAESPGWQIRPSKFGGSFNQPNVPTINVVVDMVAPQRRIAKIIGGEVDVKA